jgi:hypothetical protein
MRGGWRPALAASKQLGWDAIHMWPIAPTSWAVQVLQSHWQGSIGLMSDTNKRNLVYFESSSMRGLYDCMDEWQQANNRRLLSVTVQQDGGNYCCIALTNPTEVVITSPDGNTQVDVYTMKMMSGDVHNALWTHTTA